MKEEQNPTTQLDPTKHRKYLDYFGNNAYLFYEAEKSKHYQGLFLLGVLIGKIEIEEVNKTGRKTFSNRLNFRGISPRKVQSLYGTVVEYLKIRDVVKDGSKTRDTKQDQECEEQQKVYDKWRVEQLLAYCTECLMGIEASNLSPQEVVFYILAGRSYESYIRLSYKSKGQASDEGQSQEQDNQIQTQENQDD